MSSPVLVSELADRVLTLTLNRPERRNAMNGELVESLMEVFRGLPARDDVGCVVLTGAGEKAFCSGADLDPAAAAAGPYAMHQGRKNFVELLRAMRDGGAPIVAKLAGPALAGGVGLVAASDLAIAADDVYLSTPEIKRGLFPMMIMSLIARSIGRKHALELVMLGEKVPAPEAARIGLINRAVPRDTLDETVANVAGKLASYSPAILRLGREAYYTMEDMPLDNALDYLCNQLTVNTLTEDAMEGIMAFMQKRAPEWKGK